LAPGARFIVLADQKPVIRSNAERTEAAIRWFGRDDLEKLGLPTADALFLGVDRSTGVGHFAIAVTEHRARNAPGGLEIMRPIVDLRSLAMQGIMASEELSLLGQAKALTAWHENTRCCGHCGGTTLVKDGGWRRKCWACGQEHFPRTDPVVIMLIVDPANDRCLLGHEARFAEKMYSALAGFIEPGEDIEHAVRRETFEETGVRVGKVRFHSTQPWPFPHSLMIGCLGFAESTEIDIDPKEIQEARWFARADIKLMLDGKHPEGWWVPGRQAIARSLITSFAEGAAGTAAE
ncbi:MAG: NAD(+) diphosphatase, partial [Hyphomicrobiaceae bacterium]